MLHNNFAIIFSRFVTEMSLAHVLLTSLVEKPSTGIELARRFDRSMGFFWNATHQQIYRELNGMLQKYATKVKEISTDGLKSGLYLLTVSYADKLNETLKVAIK